ncbi:ABC transporter permease, partial [Fulvivirga lutimaris]|uniref:ABC transporter permease n=1 Tax=Fulvivirga lutimaris TaxID=1819566 RepID=UPI0012BC2635
MLKNYFLVALRNITRNKTISIINIVGLSISMSVCLLLILIVADQFSYDDFHAKKDKTYRVITDRLQEKEYLWSTATTAYPLLDKLKEHTGIESITGIQSRFNGVSEWNNKQIPFQGYYTDNDFFEIFDFPLAKGNSKEAFTLPNSVVLTQELATKLFGDKDPLNEVISVENKGEFVVTGVLDKLPGKTHLTFDALASIGYQKALQQRDTSAYTGLDDWHAIYDSYIYMEVKDGIALSTIINFMKNAAADNYEKEGKFEYTFLLQPLTGITPGPLLSNTTGFGLPNFVIYMMLGISLIVLCSACFNYANLTTARAINRSKEIGVRKVVGALRWHIFGQFMVEAALIAVLSFFFADLMVQFIVPTMNSYFASLGAPMSFDETSNLVWWFLGFVVIAGLVSGIIPALVFSATQPLSALKKALQSNYSSKKGWFSKFDIRKVLVVVQFAFSIFFVITMMTVYMQLNFVLNKDHGFRTEGIVNVHLQGVEFKKIAPALSALSSAQLVSSTSHLPALGTNNTTRTKLKGADEPFPMSYFAIGDDFIEMMNLTLVAGKNYPDVMPEEEKFVIINETAVKRLGFDSPIDAVGESFIINDFQDDSELQIIGVVKDYHYERLDEEIGPMALRYLPDYANNALIMAGGNTKQVISDIEAVWKEHTTRPFEYSLYKDDLKLSYGHFEALLMVTGYVTIIVVSLACLGLLGMVIYQVQNKTKEIGIRKVLGASGLSILSTVGRSFLILMIIAYAIGGPLSYFVNDMWLSTNVYRIDFGAQIIVAGFMMVLLVVLVTVGSQLYKAMRINPSDSLRSE